MIPRPNCSGEQRVPPPGLPGLLLRTFEWAHHRSHGQLCGPFCSICAGPSRCSRVENRPSSRVDEGQRRFMVLARADEG